MHKLSAAFGAFCLAGLMGCSPITTYSVLKGNQNAKAAVADFHQALDQGHFEEIYAATDPDFKKASGAKDFVPILAAIHRKLGTVQSSTLAGSQTRTFNTQTSVALNYQTKFAEGDGLESFTFRINLGRATLVGYNISSVALILK